MKTACKLIVLLLAFVLALAALGLVAFIGIGALLARWLPVSLFQASILAIAATATIALIIQAFLAMMQLHMDHDIQFDDSGWEPVEYDDSLPNKPTTSAAKVGRNQSCPCGSGRKFKSCCGQSTMV